MLPRHRWTAGCGLSTRAAQIRQTLTKVPLALLGHVGNWFIARVPWRDVLLALSTRALGRSRARAWQAYARVRLQVRRSRRRHDGVRQLQRHRTGWHRRAE